MCQPGRPGPTPKSQVGSPGLVAFHSTKSRASSLSYLSRVDARAGLDAVVVEPRQLAVVGQRRDLEVDRAVAAVGVAVAARAPSIMSAIAARFASSVARGVLLDRLEAERRGVLAERRDVLVGVLAQRHARPSAPRAIVRSSTSVKFITWCTRQPQTCSQRAAQHVDGRRTCGSCRCARGRRPSGRRCTCGPCCRGRGANVFFLAGQRVVEAHAVRQASRHVSRQLGACRRRRRLRCAARSASLAEADLDLPSGAGADRLRRPVAASAAAAASASRRAHANVFAARAAIIWPSRLQRNRDAPECSP